jgi:hypothetical protein
MLSELTTIGAGATYASPKASSFPCCFSTVDQLIEAFITEVDKRRMR